MPDLLSDPSSDGAELAHTVPEAVRAPPAPVPYVTADPGAELPAACRPLLDELVERLLAAGRARAYDPATYIDGSRAAYVARTDAAAILRSRLDELSPEVATLRAAVYEANRRTEEATREATVFRDARDELLTALAHERRTIGAMRTDRVVTAARATTVAHYLRRDAAKATNAVDAERMAWAANMLDLGEREVES